MLERKISDDLLEWKRSGTRKTQQQNRPPHKGNNKPGPHLPKPQKPQKQEKNQ